MEAAAAAEPARSSPSTAAAAPWPPKQRPQRRRGGPAEEQVRVRRRTLEAVLEQCQRTLEMLKNADLEPDPDAGDEIGSKGSAGEEEEEEEEEEVQSRTPSSVNYETDEGLKELVIDAKENGISVVPAVVKRMLEKTLFLFGFVDILGCSVTQRVEGIAKLQNKRAQIAFDRLFANSHIETYLDMDLGAELELKTLKKMSPEYARVKELAMKGVYLLCWSGNSVAVLLSSTKLGR